MRGRAYAVSEVLCVSRNYMTDDIALKERAYAAGMYAVGLAAMHVRSGISRERMAVLETCR